MIKTLGVQCYSVRTEMKQDTFSAIDKLKDIGFDALEPMILPMDAPCVLPPVAWAMDNLAENAAYVRSKGMEIPSAHIMADLKRFCLPPIEMAEALKKIHQIVGTKYFVFSIMFQTAEDAKAEGEYLCQVQRQIKADGLQVLYHNHAQELDMVEIGGKTMTALEYFLRFAGEDILLELDIGWAGFAGDDLAYVKKFADRIAILHLKDFTEEAVNHQYHLDTIPTEAFVAIGDGAIHTKQIIGFAEDMPRFSGIAIIDQDHAATDILQELERGYQFVKQLD